jgi:hypothetical protein
MGSVVNPSWTSAVDPRTAQHTVRDVGPQIERLSAALHSPGELTSLSIGFDVDAKRVDKCESKRLIRDIFGAKNEEEGGLADDKQPKLTVESVNKLRPSGTLATRGTGWSWGPRNRVKPLLPTSSGYTYQTRPEQQFSCAG